MSMMGAGLFFLVVSTAVSDEVVTAADDTTDNTALEGAASLLISKI